MRLFCGDSYAFCINPFNTPLHLVPNLRAFGNVPVEQVEDKEAFEQSKQRHGDDVDPLHVPELACDEGAYLEEESVDDEKPYYDQEDFRFFEKFQIR